MESGAIDPHETKRKSASARIAFGVE